MNQKEQVAHVIASDAAWAMTKDGLEVTPDSLIKYTKEKGWSWGRGIVFEEYVRKHFENLDY